MPPTTLASTRWKQLGDTAEVDDQGVLHASFHVMDTDSGHDFTVTLSGVGAVNAGYFLGALLATAEIWKQRVGMDGPMPTAHAVPALKSH